MPRLVRRAPLSERIKTYLNPEDLWDRVSEELFEGEWKDILKDFAIPIGIAFNILFMIARAGSGGASPSRADDVFGDFEGKRSSGWGRWFCSFIVQLLMLLSCANAVYTFTRRRHYRLFENAVNEPPATPSAHRVRVDSSPISSSPLRFLSNMISTETASSRAHPDETRDVWEIGVWDPQPLCLRMFCQFSPGHILISWLFLPTAPLEPRPSVTWAKTILLTVLLSVQLTLFDRFFSQQTRDAAIIQKEVLHEYDTKYVHPSLNRPARDVGIQTPPSKTSKVTEVDTYTPTTIINRGFRTNPNPAYAAQFDPDNAAPELHSRHPSQPFNPLFSRAGATPSTQTPPMNGYTSTTTSTADLSSPIRPPRGDGGSLGVYTHAASPLKKAASTNYLRADGDGASSRRQSSPEKRPGSPLKRMSTPGDGIGRMGATGLNQRVDGLRGRESSRRESGRF